MAKVYTTSYSAISAEKDIKISVLNADTLSLISESPSEAVEKMTSSPLDRPEKWYFGCKDIPDIYKNTGISIANRPSSIKGVQIMVRHESITEVTDSVDASYLKHLPFAAWTCVRIPINNLISEDQVLKEVSRSLAGLFGSNEDVSSTRLGELVRSALRAEN